MSGKLKKAGNKRVKAGNTLGTASARDKDKVIDELINRVAFLEKELQSRQDELHANADKHGNKSQEHKRDEQALREGEERLRLAQHVAHVGTFEWNIRTGVNTWTPELEAMYGLPPGGFPGREDAWEQLVHPEDRPEVLRRVEEAMEKGGFEGEWRVVWPDGTVHWLHGRAFVFKDESGKPLKLIGVNIDITERKQMEAELRRSRDNLEQIVQERTKELRESEASLARAQFVAHIGSWSWDINSGEIEWSDESYRLLGYKPGEVRPITFDFFISHVHPDDKESLYSAIRESIRSRKPFSIDFRIVRPDGIIVYVHNDGEVLYEAKGTPVRMFGTIQDITERKRAEDALRDSQTHLSSIFRAAPTGIGVVVDRVINEVNDKLCEMTGYSSEELLGKSARIFYPRDEDYQYVGQEKYRQISRRGTGSVETRWLRKDGRIIDVLLSSTPLKPGNLSAGVTFTALDITERKRAERRIAHLASFPELNPNPIFEVSTDGLVRYANHAAKQLFPDLTLLMTDHPVLSGFNMIVGDLRGGKSYLVRDIKFKDTYLQQSIYLVPDSETVRFYILDITERKRAEEALIAAKTEAELYLDLMSHDISNMHQIIMGSMEMAQGIMENEGRLEISNKELIDTSMATLQRSAKLIESIRNIQRLRSGEYRFEKIDLGEMLESMIRGYSGLEGRDISVSYKPVHGCYVLANSLLKDILSNLIDNAVKHCDDPVRIDVSLAPVDLKGSRYNRVMVEDNGRGIPDEMKSTIFSRLKQGDTKARGTGLGLYIVKTLVEGFDGTIWVEDRVPGDHTKGARFVVLLPAVEK